MSSPDSTPDGQHSHWHILPWFNLLLLLALIAWTGLLSYYSWDGMNERKNEIADASKKITGVSNKLDAIPEGPNLEKEKKEIMEQVSKMVADCSKSSEERDKKLDEEINRLTSEKGELETFIKEQNEKVMEEINIIMSKLYALTSNNKNGNSQKTIDYDDLNLSEKEKIRSVLACFRGMITTGNFKPLANICCDDSTFGSVSCKTPHEYIEKEEKFWKIKRRKIRSWGAYKRYDNHGYYNYVLSVCAGYSSLSHKGEYGAKTYIMSIFDKGTEFKVKDIMDVEEKE